MIARLGAILVALGWFITASAPAADKIREVIQDPTFERGFFLEETKPGKHVRYGKLRRENNRPPVWALLQWSSRFPLDPKSSHEGHGGALICSNESKTVALGTPRQGGLITFAADSGKEYVGEGRKAGEPWVHLLVEQEFETPQPLVNLKSARLYVESRLLKSKPTPGHRYDPGVHAAQFLIYFTVQNRNPKSPGHGDLLWFGIPIYDNRSRFPSEIKHLDFGGTEKFIVMPDGKTFTAESAHDGKWITIDKDLLPLMLEALETTWKRGFLKDSKTLSDYYIGGMNMGWELPGSFDVSMQVRRLSLKVTERMDTP